jgi:hypothetical protein
VPTVLYVVTAIVAALWCLAAMRIARELPALAIEHVAHDADVEAVVDARAIEVLLRELDGPRPERAAELLARLHERGRVDAIPALVRVCTERGGAPLWRSLIGVLDTPAEVHAAALLAAASAEANHTELAVRAVGLAGGARSEAVEPWRGATDAALALTAEIAAHRLAGQDDAALAVLADAVRDSGPSGRAATEELCVRSHAGSRLPPTIACSRQRAISRVPCGARRGDLGGAPRATVLARGRGIGPRSPQCQWALLRADLFSWRASAVESASTPVAPEHMLTSLIGYRRIHRARPRLRRRCAYSARCSRAPMPSSPTICAAWRARSVSPAMRCVEPPRTC